MWFWKKRSDRRRWSRTSCRAAGFLTAGRTVLPGTVLDLSRGGCLFRPSRPPLFVERSGMLALGGARLSVRLLHQSRRGQQLCFTAMLTEEQRDDILSAMERERLGIAHDADATLWLAGKERRRTLEW